MNEPLKAFRRTGSISRQRRTGTYQNRAATATTRAANTVEPLIAFAEDGQGLAYLPNFLVRRQMAEGRLVTVLTGYATDRKVLRAVWPSGRHLSPKIRVFVDYLAKHLFPDESEERTTAG